MDRRRSLRRTTRPATSRRPSTRRATPPATSNRRRHPLTREIDPEGLACSFRLRSRGPLARNLGRDPRQARPEPRRGRSAKLADGTRARGVHHVRLDYGRRPLHRGQRLHPGPPVLRNEHGLVESSRGARGRGDHLRTIAARCSRRRTARALSPATSATTAADRARDRSARRVTHYRRDERGDVIEICRPGGRPARCRPIARSRQTCSTSADRTARPRPTRTTARAGHVAHLTGGPAPPATVRPRRQPHRADRSKRRALAPPSTTRAARAVSRSTRSATRPASRGRSTATGGRLPGQ